MLKLPNKLPNVFFKIHFIYLILIKFRCVKKDFSVVFCLFVLLNTKKKLKNKLKIECAFFEANDSSVVQVIKLCV